MMLQDPIFTAEHVSMFFGTGLAWSALAHVVNTFPTPQNRYGIWLLGSIQYIVGQRVAASNTFSGKQSVVTAVDTGQKP